MYINNTSKSDAKAKEDLKKFNYADITSKDGNQARDKINELMTIREHLDASVQGDDKVWIKEIVENSPAQFQMKYDLQLRKQEPHLQRAAATDIEAFLPIFTAAVDT